MSSLRLAALFLVVLVLAVPAEAATHGSGLRAPQGVHAFLLRADEAPTSVFARTPAFAWKPVAGAKKYEFVLSTSPLFAASGLVWDDPTLTSPAAAVPVMLPWITGSPHSLYARVRAVSASGRAGAWSASFGFDMRWANVPEPLAAPAGLVRWTPVEGATSYQVWYGNIDTGEGKSKIFSTTTNVADEREYYAFHQTASFMGTVLWRVRAVRRTSGTQGPANGLPVTSYGPWSPIYQSTNPAFATGPLTPQGTISDASSTAAAPVSHRLMPAFVFSGDIGLDDFPSQLYRVYVFTDSDCLNVVFKSAVVGGPAYAPRTSGPLALPANTTELDAASDTYLKDGSEGTSFTSDGATVKATEAEAASVFTPVLTTPPTAPSSGSGSSGSTPPAGSTPPTPTVDPKQPFPSSLTGEGAPIDLWDTNWPTGRYYWTVVPVFAVPVGNGTGSLTGSPVQYWDGELAQDACRAGRVASFGKTSEAALTGAGTPFASGLSPTGRLIAAATGRPVFYGTPLVAWSPALGATAYEVAWSKRAYPWKNEGNLFTFSTSATLPVGPGSWSYRVRGIDLSLPAGAQQMAWSSPVSIRIAKPKFRVAPGK